MTDNNTKRIELYANKGVAIIDAEDYPLVSGYSWSRHTFGYPQAIVKKKTILMHRVIMGAKRGQTIDT